VAGELAVFDVDVQVQRFICIHQKLSVAQYNMQLRRVS